MGAAVLGVRAGGHEAKLPLRMCATDAPRRKLVCLLIPEMKISHDQRERYGASPDGRRRPEPLTEFSALAFHFSAFPFLVLPARVDKRPEPDENLSIYTIEAPARPTETREFSESFHEWAL